MPESGYFDDPCGPDQTGLITRPASRQAKHLPPPLTLTTLRRGVRELGSVDRDLADAVRRYGPPPLWARRPGFATLVRIILEQQVSLASGRAAYSRLRAAAGRVTPQRVARLSESRLRGFGLTRQKASYCRNLSRHIVNRRLTLRHLAHLDDQAARAILLQVPGIGPWTADIYLLMALGRPDVWPHGDLALTKAAQRVKRLRTYPTQQRLRRLATAWAPWRAVAARILWHFYLSSRETGTRPSRRRAAGCDG